MTNYDFIPNIATPDPETYPVIARHWREPDRQPSSVAQEAVADALRRNWTPPDGRVFADRQPGQYASEMRLPVGVR